jgi:putative ABC transport system permease protein
VLLRPLPFPEPERLVRVYKAPILSSDLFGGTTTPPDFTDWRLENRTFTELGAYTGTGATLTGEGDPVQLEAALVTGGFFPVLAVPAHLGRTLLPEDDAFGGPDVVVLGHGLWQRQFGGRADVIGRHIELGGVHREIAGVMPPGFAFPLETDLWMPLRFSADTLATQRGAHYLSVVGRLRPGTTLEEARADMRALGARLAEAYPRTNRDYTSTVQPLREAMVGHVRPVLLVTLGAVGFVLLMVCVNVASLVLTRAVGRGRELAVRTAVGANRVQLARGLLMESGVLAVAGGALGLLLASWAVALIAAADQRLGIPLLDQTIVDGAVVRFTVGISVAAGLLFGALPAWHASRWGDLVGRLREQGPTASGRHRARHALIVFETALAVMLLVGAGLLARSFAHMVAVGLGFETERVQTFTVSLPAPRYAEPPARTELYGAVLSRVRSIPQIEAAGAINGLPLTGYSYAFSASTRDGQALVDDDQDRLTTQLRIVTPGLFEAMGIPVIRGRTFRDADSAGATRVMVVNESAARLIWGEGSALGGHLTVGTSMGLGQGNVGGEVVGVVADVHDVDPTLPPRATIYLPHAQVPVLTMRVVARTTGDPSAVIGSMRAIVSALDADLPLFQVRTMADVARAAVAQPRLLALVIAIFAATAVVLAAIGLYGVLAHAVSQRTREIGIRIALGARRAEVVRMVVGQASWLTALGITSGVLVAAASSRLLAGLLFSVRPTDPATYVAVAAGLALVALVAAWLPARRAARVDPVMALRQE